jgi:hypothetical protein
MQGELLWERCINILNASTARICTIANILIWAVVLTAKNGANKKRRTKKMRDDLEHGWIGTEDRESDEEEAVYTCEWCSEPIYAGEEYYNFNGERVCCECVKDCKRIAHE